MAHVRPNKEPDGRAARPAPPAEEKSVVQRPGANEGGREEEERGSGIATSVTGRLHDRKKRVNPPDWTACERPWTLLRLRTRPADAREALVVNRYVSCEFMKRLYRIKNELTSLFFDYTDSVGNSAQVPGRVSI